MTLRDPTERRLALLSATKPACALPPAGGLLRGGYRPPSGGETYVLHCATLFGVAAVPLRVYGLRDGRVFGALSVFDFAVIFGFAALRSLLAPTLGAGEAPAVPVAPRPARSSFR